MFIVYFTASSQNRIIIVAAWERIALGKAIHAVTALPEEQRVIHCKCIQHPQLMFRVSSPCAGEVRFDKNECPIADSATHGIGTRSIAACCEKYGAVCECKAENGWFTIQLVQTIWT